MSGTLTVVFDSSALIPLAVPSGRSASTGLLARLRAAEHRVVMSPQVYAEVAEKLRTKKSVRDWLDLPDEDIEKFITRLPEILGTKTLKRTPHLHGAVPADPKDDMVIAAAVESEAAFIVSEDPHLLDLKEYEGIKILNREDFRAELDRLGVPPLPTRKVPRRRKRTKKFVFHRS